MKCKNDLALNDSALYVSKLLFNLKRSISNHFKEYKPSEARTMNLICYGIGSIDDSFTSRFQLALLLLIVDELSADKSLVDQIGIVELYDPVFNKADRLLIQEKLGFCLSARNEQCMRSVEPHALTLFYMPHCPKSLYNNILYSNWCMSGLQSIVLLGNSFATIKSITAEDVMRRTYSYITDSFNFLEETKLEYTCDVTNAFYDINIHCFRFVDDSSYKFLDSSRLQRPVYDESDELV
jgi:hypothetical protein